MEADRHARPEQAKLADVRLRWWGASVLVPDATPELMGTLTNTSPKDRHVLPAAHAANINIILSRNVSDFGWNDLAQMSASVAHPDLFLPLTMTPSGYQTVLTDICARRSRQPNTPASLHAALSREHPRLFDAMAAVFPCTTAKLSTHQPAAEMFRGSRCILCGQPITSEFSLISGVGPECKPSRRQEDQ